MRYISGFHRTRPQTMPPERYSSTPAAYQATGVLSSIHVNTQGNGYGSHGTSPQEYDPESPGYLSI